MVYINSAPYPNTELVSDDGCGAERFFLGGRMGDRGHYTKDLGQQINETLRQKMSPGTSRELEKKDGTDHLHINSYKSFHTYKDQCDYFAKWIQREHPEAKTMKYARPYYNEYMKSLEAKGYSASTLHTANAALMKLYDIKKTDIDFYKAPVRHSEDFVRSRGVKASDAHFSEVNNMELVNFCKGVGARRNVMEKLVGNDYYTRDRLEKEVERISGLPEDQRTDREQALLRESKNVFDEHYFDGHNDFVFHYRDKHGKSRIAPIIGENKDKIVERFRNTRPDQKVWENVHKGCDVHGYRAEYATTFYRSIARDIKDIPFDKVNRGSGKKYQSEVYCCRLDGKGLKLDRKALDAVSKALGHNREDVLKKNYLRGI